MAAEWQKDAEKKFNQLMEKVPIFMRPIAQDKVSKKAEQLALENNRTEVTEKDMIDAFFIATPFGFHGPMKNDMEALGIDYTQYGYDK